MSRCGLLDLRFVYCGIKMNSNVLEVCQKNNLLFSVKFRLLK